MLTDWILRLRSLFKRDAVEQELDDELRFHFEQPGRISRAPGGGARRGHAPGAHRVRRARSNQGGTPRRTRHRLRRRSWPRRAPRVPAVQTRSGLRRARGALSRARDRRQHVDLRRAQCGPAAADAGRRARPADHGRPRPDRGMLVSRLSGCPGPQPRVLSGLPASLPMESDLEVDGESEFVVAEVVSGNYADVLGLRPSLGRWFVNDTEPAAVISHAVWQRRFNLEPGRGGPARSVRNRSRTRSSAWRRVNSPACLRRCERTSGCRSRRARGWPRNSRIAACRAC